MKGVVVTVVIVLVALTVAGFLIFSGNNGQSNLNQNPAPGNNNNQTETPQSNSTGTGSQPQTYDISIKNLAFNPSMLTINVGDTVVWTNEDGATHTVTSDSGSELDSGTLAGKSSGGYYTPPSAGGTYSHTFTTAGTFAYHCNIHPSMMKGTIVVE